MVSDIKQQYGLSDVPHELLCSLQKMPKAKFTDYIEKAR